jgi:hypothetical protein
MNRVFTAALLIPSLCAAQRVAPVPLLRESTVAALAGELSGAAAKRNLEFIARQHRMRGSAQFRAAADFIAAELKRYGLDEVTVNEFAADGRTMYGTQKARPAWDPEFAELWEVRDSSGRSVPVGRVASFEDEPVVLAQDSDSADVTAELIDVGSGTSERDYAGKDVRGKIVLIGAQPEAVAPLAVDKYGAAGMVSYAPNQVTAWWKEDENLIRWGHLGSFASRRTFAFMLSLKQARALQTRLTRGERITFHAVVRAARHPGNYSVVTALIPGADPSAVIWTTSGRGQTTTPVVARPSSRLPGPCRSSFARGRSRGRRGACASSGRARSSAPWRCFMRDPRCVLDSARSSTWTWWAAARPRRPSSMSREARSAFPRSSMTSGTPSARS